METSETVRILDLCERCRDKLRDAGYRAELVPGTSWLKIRCDQCGKQVRFDGRYELRLAKGTTSQSPPPAATAPLKRGAEE